MSVVSERTPGGLYLYRTVLHLKETAGVAARIDAVDLTFANGAAVVATARQDQPMPATGNMVAANGIADTRELVTIDANAAHPFATSVAARIMFTDSTSSQTAPAVSANVPPPADPTPITSSLTGVITDQATGSGIAGARVEALTGANAGNATTTDQSGGYTLSGLVAETFRMRASASGFDSGEQNVTVPNVTRADMALRRPPPPPPPVPCVYTVLPTDVLGAPYTGVTASLALTRTSGTCGWQATSDSFWMTLPNPAGTGSGALVYTLAPNGNFNARIGFITIQWDGGQTRVRVLQGTPPDFFPLLK
jgi:hypothetical protein